MASASLVGCLPVRTALGPVSQGRKVSGDNLVGSWLAAEVKGVGSPGPCFNVSLPGWTPVSERSVGPEPEVGGGGSCRLLSLSPAC